MVSTSKGRWHGPATGATSKRSPGCQIRGYYKISQIFRHSSSPNALLYLHPEQAEVSTTGGLAKEGTMDLQLTLSHSLLQLGDVLPLPSKREEANTYKSRQIYTLIEQKHILKD